MITMPVPFRKGLSLRHFPLTEAVSKFIKASLLVGPGIGFQVIILFNPLIGSAETPPSRFMGGLQRHLKVNLVGPKVHGVPRLGAG